MFHAQQLEVDRNVHHLEQLRADNISAVERHRALLVEAQEKIRILEAEASNERERRDEDVKGVHRELLETERGFHQEEKTLMHGQQDMLAKVVELERKLVESKTEHLQKTFQLKLV